MCFQLLNHQLIIKNNLKLGFWLFLLPLCTGWDFKDDPNHSKNDDSKLAFWFSTQLSILMIYKMIKRINKPVLVDKEPWMQGNGLNKFHTIVSEVSSFKCNPVCPTVSFDPLSRRLMVSERRSALEKAQAEGRVRDYDGQNEEKAAKIIQERYFSNKLNHSFILIICKKISSLSNFPI